jgi:parallel beta-helix repeat protein
VLLGTSTTVCNNNTIISCDFYKNCDGIELQYATNNLITACTFTQNTHAGIDAIESNNNNNIISHCEFTHNYGFGLYLSGSSNNQIAQCFFSDNSLTLVQAQDNTLLNSQVVCIHLMDDSSLLIEQCGEIDKSAITSQQSHYEIRTKQVAQLSQEKNNDASLRHPLLTIVLFRLIILKSIHEQLCR